MVATFTKGNLRDDEEYITMFGIITCDGKEVVINDKYDKSRYKYNSETGKTEYIPIGKEKKTEEEDIEEENKTKENEKENHESKKSDEENKDDDIDKYIMPPRPHKVKPKVFHKALSDTINDLIEDNKNKNRPDNSWRVTLHGVEEYKNTDNFTLSRSTFAISKDGDIISVAKNPKDTFRGSKILKYAVEHGGKKLDSYDGNNRFYQKCGFEPIAACKGIAEYEPKGIKRVEDIIFYRYNPNYKPDFDELDENKNGDCSITINKLKMIGAYFEDAETGYDKAKAYRNKKMEE